jgi:hypothetical protein
VNVVRTQPCHWWKIQFFVVRPCEILHWASHNLVHYVGLHSGVAKVRDGCSMYVVTMEVYKGKFFGASSFHHCKILRKKTRNFSWSSCMVCTKEYRYYLPRYNSIKGRHCYWLQTSYHYLPHIACLQPLVIGLRHNCQGPKNVCQIQRDLFAIASIILGLSSSLFWNYYCHATWWFFHVYCIKSRLANIPRKPLFALIFNWFSMFSFKGFQKYIGWKLAITPHVHKLLNAFHCLTLDKMLIFIYYISPCYVYKDVKCNYAFLNWRQPKASLCNLVFARKKS